MVYARCSERSFVAEECDTMIQPWEAREADVLKTAKLSHGRNYDLCIGTKGRFTNHNYRYRYLRFVIFELVRVVTLPNCASVLRVMITTLLE